MFMNDYRDLLDTLGSIIPDSNSRTNNDPVYLMSSKDSFVLLQRMTDVPSYEIPYPKTPIEIWGSEKVLSFTLTILRVAALKNGWADVKVFNGQLLFISPLVRVDTASTFELDLKQEEE